MAIKTSNEDMFSNIILTAAKAEIERILEEEANKAAKEVKTRVESMADSIALKILKHYEVTTDRDRLVITVWKNIQAGE